MGCTRSFLFEWQFWRVRMAEKKKKGNTVQAATELALPIAEKLGVELWEVRFEKEGTEWFLRYFIDKDGLTIEDCEAFSRAIDPVLDENDPIEQGYCLEVSSPGIERKLNTEEHVRRYLGSRVDVRFIRPPEGKNTRSFNGVLEGIENGVVTLRLDDGERLAFDRGDAAYIKLFYDYDSEANDAPSMGGQTK